MNPPFGPPALCRGSGPGAPDYSDVWVVLPTFNEIDNLASIVPAILDALPGCTIAHRRR